jgi:hypothetical protein
MGNNISSSSNRVEDGDQSVKEWSSTQHVSFYLNKAANLPQRTEGEQGIQGIQQQHLKV